MPTAMVSPPRAAYDPGAADSPLRPVRRPFALLKLLPALCIAVVACSDDVPSPTAPRAAPAPVPQLSFSSSSGGVYTFTTDAEFDQGTLVSVNHDSPNGNQLQLNTSSGTFPFIWVALSQRCTIAKINTTTGAILGEYRTIADGAVCNESSRTTVAIDGSVWVGHRGQGGVTHVGLSELNQCVDRDGSGTIETSTAYGDVRPWTGGSPSPVANARDECIIHHVNTDALGFGDTRHMSIDANNKLWVGSFTGVRGFVRVNGTTGTIDSPVTPTTCGGYGGLIDANGVIWSASSGSLLLRWDPNAPAVAGSNPRCLNVPNYGLAIDQAGWVWASVLSGGQVRKVSPDGNTVLGPFAHGSSNAQGLAIDANGDVWVSSSLFCGGGCTIGHLKNDGTFVGNIPTPTGAGSTGISVDADGKIWAANRSSHTATRINPNAGPIGGGGVPVGAVDMTVNFPATPGRPLPFPYNYSDMTGAQLFNNTAPQGSWTVTQDGGTLGQAWTSISWNGEPQGSVPTGGSITVEARAAETAAGLGAQAYVPVTSGGALALTGQFIQVRVTLRAGDEDASPVLSDLTIVGDDDPPVVTNVNPTLVAVNTPFTVTADATDATTGNSNIASAQYSIDGGAWTSMAATDGAYDEPAEALTAPHPGLPTPDVRELCVRATDAAGNTSAPTCVLIVFYDPSAGFVTGGGWINSPAGALRADATVTGRANFGFVSRYQKGATTPTGQTEFQFQAGSLNFHSTTYEWLVIAGARAQYRGTGTVNGVPGYSFLLTATDGQIAGGGGVDKFRIKITGPGGIVYDNVPGGSDDIGLANPQAIAGGSIVIHAK